MPASTQWINPPPLDWLRSAHKRNSHEGNWSPPWPYLGGSRTLPNHQQSTDTTGTTAMGSHPLAAVCVWLWPSSHCLHPVSCCKWRCEQHHTAGAGSKGLVTLTCMPKALCKLMHCPDKYQVCAFGKLA